MAKSNQSFPMMGGDGTHSYKRNSLLQKATIDVTKEKIKQSILENLDLLKLNPDLNVFTIADFGCSTGPNTFSAVENIIDTVKFKHQDTENTLDESLEFQVFFNDHTTNDFNTLFRAQTPFSDHGYFTCGVPGSFYGRLLPRNSLHVGHTSTTIHWLSQVPQGICDRNSPAWNKTYIHCNGVIEEAANAYKAQFRKDINGFLEARAEELVSGGLMIVLGACLPDDVPMAQTLTCIQTDILQDCLMDLVKSGVISEEKLESFNLPMYFPQFSELKREIEKNKSFTIETMERIKHPMEDMPVSNEIMIATARAVSGTLFEQHFGEGVVNQLFQLFPKKLDESQVDLKDLKKLVSYFLLIKRN